MEPELTEAEVYEFCEDLVDQSIQKRREHESILRILSINTFKALRHLSGEQVRPRIGVFRNKDKKYFPIYHELHELKQFGLADHNAFGVWNLTDKGTEFLLRFYEEFESRSPLPGVKGVEL